MAQVYANGTPLPCNQSIFEVVRIDGTVQVAGGGGSANVAALGATNDAAASSDTGDFSVIALMKRGLQNWTTLIGRIPSLSLSGRIRTEELGQPLVARQLAATSSSTNTLLTSTVRRISIHARGGNIRYMVGSTSQTANTSSHYIAQGERLDISVPATPNIAVLRADSTDCTLELTELGEPV